MSDNQLNTLMILFSVAMLALVFYLGTSIWDECREAGFSTFYCLKQAAR